MKLGKTSWLILIVGILIIAFGSLGFTRAQQVDQQGQLDNELSVAEKRLANLQLRDLQNEKLNLDQQLEQAQFQLKTAKDALRQPIESIEVIDALFEIAAASNVVITDISSSGISRDKLQKIDISVSKLNIGVRGTVLDLITFVTNLNTDFAAGVVESAEINTRDLTAEEDESAATGNETEEESEEETEESTGAATPTASIRMIIYRY